MLLCCKQQAGSPGVPDPMPWREHGFPGRLWLARGEGAPGGNLTQARCHAPPSQRRQAAPAHTQRKVPKEMKNE